MEKVLILLLAGFLSSCVLERNRNFELTVIHPETERGVATLDDGTGAQPLGHFTSKAYFAPQNVTLHVEPVGETRSVFLGFENIRRYYGIDGNGETGTWTLGSKTVRFTVGPEWKVVKVHLAPEIYKDPMALGSGAVRKFLYQTNISGQDQVWLGNTGTDPALPVSPGLATDTARPTFWHARGWQGFPWIILDGAANHSWVVSAEDGTTARLSSTAEDRTFRYVQYGNQGLYFLTGGQYGTGSGVLKRLDPATGTVAVLWSPPGQAQDWIGPLSGPEHQADDPVYLADFQRRSWVVEAPAPSTESTSYEGWFLTLSQLDPSQGTVTLLSLGTQAPDLPTELTDTDPSTRRLLLIGEWADGVPFWIVGPQGVQKGTIPPGQTPSLWRARLAADPGVILVPDGAEPEHWYAWTVATPSVRLAEVPAIGDWRSPHIDFWDDWSLLPEATSTYPDGAQIVTVTDVTGAQDLAVRPPGAAATLVTGPKSGQEVP